MLIANIGIVLAAVLAAAPGPTGLAPIVTSYTALGTFCVPSTAVPRTLPARDTLVTGDVVTVRLTSSGCLRVDVTQALPGETIRVSTDGRGHIIAIPAVVDQVIASSLDDGGMVDRRMFDVTAHIDDERDDASCSWSNLVVMYKDLATATAVSDGTAGVFGDTLIDKTLLRPISGVTGGLAKTLASGTIFRATVSEWRAAKATGGQHDVYWIEYGNGSTMEWT